VNVNTDEMRALTDQVAEIDRRLSGLLRLMGEFMGYVAGRPSAAAGGEPPAPGLRLVRGGKAD
jgi:hypothetical protein